MFFYVLLFLFAAFLAVFYVYRHFYVQQIFVKQGIPGPTPNWLFGNALEFADETKRHLVVPNWTKKYGKVYGYFEGPTPTLVTSDVEIVNQAFVKQADIFHGRRVMAFQSNPDRVDDSFAHMLQARGERWKRLRTVCNPTFSAAKLRSLMPLMNKCERLFMKLIDEKAASANPAEGFNIFEAFQSLTLDTIGEAAFGVELNSMQNQRGGDKHPLLKSLQLFFKDLFEIPIVVVLVTIMPEFTWILNLWETARGAIFRSGFFVEIWKVEKLMTKIYEDRKVNPVKDRQDLLQMMLELESSAESLGRQRGLTGQEIVAQAILFMIAGYETSSNTLAFTSFFLANHPEAQQRLIDEIDLYFQDPSKTVDYESVHELKYLDCVIKETLRLLPVAQNIINRLAMDDTEINGIRIPKGVSVQADIWTIHRDEAEWGPVDPAKFHPERFLDDYPTTSTRSDAAFLAFGFGPRICIGMRFAMLELKLTLVNLLLKYRIEKTDRTGSELKLIANFSMTVPDGVWVRLASRHSRAAPTAFLNSRGQF